MNKRTLEEPEGNKLPLNQPSIQEAVKQQDSVVLGLVNCDVMNTFQICNLLHNCNKKSQQITVTCSNVLLPDIFQVNAIPDEDLSAIMGSLLTGNTRH